MISASHSDLAKWFPNLPISSDKNFEADLISRLTSIGRAGTIRAADSSMHGGMEKLGLIDGSDLNLLVLPRNSVESLGGIANIIAPDFEDLLRKTVPSLRSLYASSPYRDEVSFEEYFIWWYHFFYTRVTNELAAKRIIRLPRPGNTTYLVLGPND